jgi:hypothetical protein
MSLEGWHVYKNGALVKLGVLAGGGGTPSVSTLVGRSDFNAASPTLRGGAPITGNALTRYQNILDHYANNQWWGGSSAVSYATLGGLADQYDIARSIWMKACRGGKHAFRMTGDLRLLSYVLRIMNYAYAKLRTGWDPALTVSPPSTGASPYLCWVVKAGGPGNTLIGTDLHLLHEVKCFLAVVEMADWLEQNRTQTCPFGWHDYDAEATKWRTLALNNFLPKWKGEAPPGDNTVWRAEYRGRQRLDATGYRDRCKGNEYVLFRRNDFHTWTSSILISHYLWRLTGDTGYRDARDSELASWQNEFYATPGARGTNRHWPHGAAQMNSGLHYAQPQNYFEYVVNDMLEHWFIGTPLITDTWLTECARSIEEWFLETTTGKRDLQGEVARGGLPASATTWNTATNFALALQGNGLICHWDDSPTQRSVTVFNNVATTHGSKTTCAPCAVFLAEVL